MTGQLISEDKLTTSWVSDIGKIAPCVEMRHRLVNCDRKYDRVRMFPLNKGLTQLMYNIKFVMS